MPKSKRSQEGYFINDNRVSEGVSDELMRSVGIDMPAGAGRDQYEAPT